MKSPMIELMEIVGSGRRRVEKSEEMIALMRRESRRACGDCSLCCRLLDVPEAGKPKTGWCPHCVKGGGCSIYERRPDPCRGYGCLWLVDGTVPDHWRPTRSKMVLDYHVVEAGAVLRVHVHPKHPNRWREEPYLSELRQKARQGLLGYPFRHMTVIVNEDAWRWTVLPDHEVPFGPGVALRVSETHWEFVPCATDEAVKTLGGKLERFEAVQLAYRAKHPRATPLETATAALRMLAVPGALE